MIFFNTKQHLLVRSSVLSRTVNSHCLTVFTNWSALNRSHKAIWDKARGFLGLITFNPKKFTERIKALASITNERCYFDRLRRVIPFFCFNSLCDPGDLIFLQFLGYKSVSPDKQLKSKRKLNIKSSLSFDTGVHVNYLHCEWRFGW